MAKGNKSILIMPCGANQSIESKKDVTEKESKLINHIEEFDLVEIHTNDYHILTKKILKKLQEKKAKLIVNGENYTITLDGKYIFNYENELNTELNFIEENQGFAFILNEGKKLSGKLTLQISKNLPGKYLYLYNSSKGIYQLVDNERLEKPIDKAGKYYITNDRISKINSNIMITITIGVIIIGIIATYIVL